MAWFDDPVEEAQPATSRRQPASVSRPAWADDPVEEDAPPSAMREQLKRTNPGEYDPQSPEYRAKYGATSGMSGTDRFMAGAGKAVVDLGRGIRQIGADVADVVSPRAQTVGGLVSGADPSRGAALRRDQDEVNARDADLMGTGAGVAGNIAGNVASFLVPGAIAARGAQAVNLARTANVARALTSPTTYRAAAASGALMGALQPVATGESRALNTGIGAAFGVGGNAVANTVGRVAQPVKQTLSKAGTRAVQVLQAAGVPMDVVQRTGSRVGQVVKRAIDDNPITGPGQKAFAETQQRAFTRAVLRTIGADADAATDDVMGAASARIGQVFDDVAARNPVRYDAQLNTEIARVARDAFRELPSNEAAVITRQVEEIFEKARQGGGAIDGAAYQNLRTSLGRISSQRSPLGHWAGELRSTIDDAMQRSANPADRDALKVARSQYRRMLQLEGAIDKEGAGQISAARLANSLGTKANRRSSIYGRGDTALVRLAQAGKQVLPDKFPNSGTASRLLGQVALGTAAGAGIGASEGNVSGGALAGLAAGTAGLAGARALLNRQGTARYLGEGLAPGIARNAFARIGGSGALRTAAASTALSKKRQQEERR